MTKTEQIRLTNWRFKVLQQAAECRARGSHLPTFRDLPPSVLQVEKRFAEHGTAGFATGRAGRTIRPEPNPLQVIGKILYLRENYHFGAGRIADYLKRFHQLSIATSSVHRILVRHGLGRLPANQKHRPHKQRWKRYEKPQPGHRLQMDVKFLERIPGTRRRLYQFTAIDDCTRIRVLKIYDRCNQARRSGSSTRFAGGCRSGSGHPDRQRRGVPVTLSLAPRRPGYPPRLHPPAHAAPERQGGAIPPRGRPGVLPAAGPGWHQRRHPSVQRQAAGVGGLLQLPPTAWGARRANPVRTAPRENESRSVTHVMGTYTIGGGGQGRNRTTDTRIFEYGGEPGPRREQAQEPQQFLRTEPPRPPDPMPNRSAADAVGGTLLPCGSTASARPNRTFSEPSALFRGRPEERVCPALARETGRPLTLWTPGESRHLTFPGFP